MTVALPLAVTMGEPAGIGGELSLKAWLARRAGTRPFFVLDDPQRLTTLARTLGLDVPVRAIARAADAGAVFGSALPVLPVTLGAEVKAGHPDTANAPATIATIGSISYALPKDGMASSSPRPPPSCPASSAEIALRSCMTPSR